MAIDAAFTHFPTFSTDHLHFRQLRPTDAEAFFAIRSDREVTDSYAQEPFLSLEDAYAAMQRLQVFYEQHEAIFWGITFKETDTLIGTCTIWNFGPDFHYAEFGYEMNRAYWRQGIMTEALPALLTYGFNKLGLHRIEATVHGGNTRSRGLLLKFGFTYEGNARQRNFFHGHFRDEWHFGLLKDEWLRGPIL